LSNDDLSYSVVYQVTRRARTTIASRRYTLSASELVAWHNPTECGSCSLSKLPTIDQSRCNCLGQLQRLQTSNYHQNSSTPLTEGTTRLDLRKDGDFIIIIVIVIGESARLNCPRLRCKSDCSTPPAGTSYHNRLRHTTHATTAERTSGWSYTRRAGWPKHHNGGCFPSKTPV